MESIIITETDDDNSSISYSHPIIDERGVLENQQYEYVRVLIIKWLG